MEIKLRNVQKKAKSSKKREINWSQIFDIELGSKELSDAQKGEFYDELGMLLEAGLDIQSSFNIILREKRKAKVQEFYTSIHDRLMKGMALSEAMNESKRISSMEYYSIKIGEETGRFADVLNDLSNFYSQKIKWRKQIISALSYPVMVMVTAILVIFFMVNFIVPLFEDVFKRFNADLPAITNAVLSFSNWMQSYYGYVLFIIFFVVGFHMVNKKKIWYKSRSSNLILKIPFVKELVLKARMSRFCHAFAKMVNHQIPILTAIDLCAKMTNFYPLQMALYTICSDVERGSLLSESMEKHPIFDLKLISLTKVGEEINQLGGIYEKLSEQYSDDFQYKISSINNILEPALILIIGGLIALILISMYLPMFQLNNNFM